MTQEQLLERLRSRCSRAEYSTGQVAAYARRWLDKGDAAVAEESRDKVVEEIVARLVEERFVDDNRFAVAFVRDKLKFNGWGKQKIVFKLRSLGVAADIIERALRENYYCADSDCGGGEERLSGQKVLERLLEKKWKSLKEDEPLQVRKAKAVRFAAGRGFEYGDIIAALAKIM